MPSKRPPQPSLRDEQVELTRTRILDAAAELISTDGVFDFTIQQVADRARVSHRTIYRHFPDRTALLDELSARVGDIISERADIPSMADEEFDPVTGVDMTWRLFDEERTLLEALVTANVGAGTSRPARRQRNEALRKSLRDALAHLEPNMADAVLAVLQSFSNSTTWYVMHRDHDIDVDRAREAVQWAMRVLLAELRSGGGPKPGKAPTT